MPARREGNSVEGFGIVYLEAGWYGVPVACGARRRRGRCGARRRDGLCCATPTDQTDVARQIERLLDDGETEDAGWAPAASQRARGEPRSGRAALRAVFWTR